MIVGIVYAVIVLDRPLCRGDEFDGEVRPLPRLPAGLQLDPAREGRAGPGVHARTLLIAQPRLAAGDLDGLPPSVFHYAGLLQPTLVASLEHTDAGHPIIYRLHQVGVGFSVPKEDRQIVVTSASQKQLGIDLDLIGRQVLAQSEQQLSEIIQVARDRQSVLFDIPSRIAAGGEHHPWIMRHLVRLDPMGGRLSTCVWLLEPTVDHGLRMVENRIELLPAGYREDRRLHVRRDKFFLGIPTQEAIALVDIPRGTSLACRPSLASLAASSHFTSQSLIRLNELIHEAILERQSIGGSESR
jgi:hypothetical protein